MTMPHQAEHHCSGKTVAFFLIGMLFLSWGGTLAWSLPPRFEDSFGDGSDGDLEVAEGETVVMNPVATYVIDENPAGQRTLQVADVTGFAVGDEVLIISMIDTTTEDELLNDAGRYETQRIAQLDASSMTFIDPLNQTFTSSSPSVCIHQVIRIPNWRNVVVNGTMTTNAWDGAVGGVLCFRATGTVRLGANSIITMSHRGYRGSMGGQGSSNGYVGESYCLFCNSVMSSTPIGSGGGGGIYVSRDNFGQGGSGGHANKGMPDPPGRPEAGEGGDPVGSEDMARIYMGAGGGAGASWNSRANNFAGDGGGIILFTANTVKFEEGATVESIGENGQNWDPPYRATCGGGAGGSIYIASNQFDGVEDTDFSVLGAFQGDPGYQAGDGRMRLKSVIEILSTGPEWVLYE